MSDESQTDPPPGPNSPYKVQGFFICHIIVIQGIIRSEM